VIPAGTGWSVAAALLAVGLGLGTWLGYGFVALLLGYIATNAVYSLWLKKVPILDVLILAGFYTLRLFAGALAVNVPISEWLLAFSLFLFFSLALAKRVSELMLTQGKVPGRGYASADTAQLAIFGSASGYLAVLVYALFINSAHVQSYYNRPFLLWLIFPILLYWISRIWLIANRGELDSDPLVFTLRDRASQGMVLAALLAVLLARGLFF
jgi:4-hydroxybenzoate polyprenyltransferase